MQAASKFRILEQNKRDFFWGDDNTAYYTSPNNDEDLYALMTSNNSDKNRIRKEKEEYSRLKKES